MLEYANFLLILSVMASQAQKNRPQNQPEPVNFLIHIDLMYAAKISFQDDAGGRSVDRFMLPLGILTFFMQVLTCLKCRIAFILKDNFDGWIFFFQFLGEFLDNQSHFALIPTWKQRQAEDKSLNLFFLEHVIKMG